MQTKVNFYTGDPLCQSIDFLYTASLCGGDSCIGKFPDLSTYKGANALFLPLSILDIRNLSRNHFIGDLPQFEGRYIFDRINTSYFDLIKSGKMIIFIDYSGEGAYFSSDIMTEFHRELVRLDINPRHVVMINESHAFKNQYNLWCAKQNTTPINVVSYNHAKYHFAGTMAVAGRDDLNARSKDLRDAIEKAKPRRKIFVCLNNIAKLHRVALVGYLHHCQQMAGGFVSLIESVGSEYHDHFFRDSNALLGERSFDRELFDYIMKLIPIYADTEAGHARGELAGRPGADFLYTESYFSIVTESDFSDGSIERFTEKVFKPIVNFHPFIVFGNPGTLRLLKEEGFLTFDPYIDETYDSVCDPVVRFQMLLSELERLMQLSEDKWQTMIEEIEPILSHNFNKFRFNTLNTYIHDPVHSKLSKISAGNYDF